MALHFLVIDDDELSRELLSLLIAAEGHGVESVASGEAALARLKLEGRAVPDVILSDMQMPGLSGEALAAQLRAAMRAETKLLAMSGSWPGEAALDGFDGFLLKPFAMEELELVVSTTRTASELTPPKINDRSGNGAGESDVPPLDEEIYARMAKMMPPAQLGELYAMCLTDARKRIAQMATLADVGDDDGYRRAAHTVKGGCGMIGATELYGLAETAERDGLSLQSQEEAGTSGVKAMLERFSHACDRLERILEQRS